MKFFELNPEQQRQARARFFNANHNDGWHYEIGTTGHVLCRNRRPPTETICPDCGTKYLTRCPYGPHNQEVAL